MRRFILMSLAAAAALALAGCGFHLRGAATFAFDSIYLNSAGSPSFNNELRRAFGPYAPWGAKLKLTRC